MRYGLARGSLLVCFSPTFSPRGFLMGTIVWLVFQTWFFLMRFFYGLFFVYRFGMLETRSLGGGYCHAGEKWGLPGPITGRRSGQQDAERQQLVGALCLRSLEGPRASNATSQEVLGRNR